MMTRRQFSRAAAVGLVVPALTARWSPAAPVGGVRLGVQTYSFREIAKAGAANGVDVILAAMKTCGVDECELWSPQIQRPAPGPGYYEDIRRRFTAAGMSIYAYNYSFAAKFTDDEIDHGFTAAKALGAEVITASTTLTVARRLVPFVEKHRLPVAMHNHSNLTDPNEFATPQSFMTALEMSPFFRINLDIGHFTAADFDALAFLEAHHARITNLHLKDRRKRQGDNVPWGSGDTPIREVLLWLKRTKSPVRAYVEYEYAGTRGTLAEVTACVDFAKQVLTA